MQTMLPLRPLVLCALVSWCLADEVRLRDGRVLEGDVVSAPDATVVDLRTGSGSLIVVQHVPVDQVERIDYGPSPRLVALEKLRAERAQLGDRGDASALWALALRARELRDQVLFRELAADIVASERDHGEARKALGMVRYRGVWMRANEAAIARGEVLHQGQWLSWAAREEQVQLAARRQADAQARREAREREARQRAIDRAVDEPAAATLVPGYTTRGGAGIPLYANGGGAYYPGLSPHVVYWPPVCPAPGPGYGGGVSVHGHGGGSSSSWDFSWSF